MNRHPLLLLLLLLTLLNHAVLACDSVVLHSNTLHHPVSGLTVSHQHDSTTAAHATANAEPVANMAADTPANSDEHSEPHGHVLCFVAYTATPAFDAAALTVLPLLQIMAPAQNTAPPVPPPNS